MEDITATKIASLLFGVGVVLEFKAKDRLVSERHRLKETAAYWVVTPHWMKRTA